jgi:hypothetical protein
MLNKILLSLVTVLLLVLQVIQPWASTEGQEEAPAVPQETPSLDVMPPLESVEKKLERNLADASSTKSPEEEVDQRLMRLGQKMERRLDSEKRMEETGQGGAPVSPQGTFPLDIIQRLESIEKKLEHSLADEPSTKSPEEEVDQRLMRLEQKLERLLDTEKRIKEANKGVRDDVTFYTSIVANGFNALAVFAAILALFAINIYFAFKERIKNDEKEIKSILKRAHKHNDKLEKELSKKPFTEKFTKKILEIARKTATEGTGIEVLRAQAVLAQEENRWQDALTYWRSMLKVFPQDVNSLFGASLAASKLAEKSTGDKQKYYISCAESYFKKFLPKHLDTAIYTNWGLLYSIQAQLAKNSEERKRFFDLATSKFQCATEKDPHHAATWSNWGTLYVRQAKTVENTKERERFFSLAKAKYERATQEDPHHAATWSNWGNLCVEQAKTVEDARERKRFLSLAEAKYKRATQENPHYAGSWCNWGAVHVEQAKTVEDAKEREHFLSLAEAKYERATQEDPHLATIWFNKACLSALFNRPAECVQFLEKWREIQPDASLDKLDNDEDFDLVRTSKEFLDFRDTLQKKSL